MAHPDHEPNDGTAAFHERRVLDEVAEWLERRYRPLALYERVAIAASLRDGTWRTDGPIKGLRERDLLTRQAEELHARGVAVDDMPPQIRDHVQQLRTTRTDTTTARQAEIDRILREDYDLDPSTTVLDPHPRLRRNR